MKMKVLVSALAVVTLTLGCIGAAQAADPRFVVKLGLADVEPKSDNGTLAGAEVGISNSVRPSLTLEYLITPNIGIEILAAWPFENKVSLSAPGSNAQVGSVNVLPPTLSLQYHFLPDNLISPFIGVGINYALMYNAQTTGGLVGHDLSIDSSWGFAAHAGVDFNFSKNWLATFDVRWIQMKNDVRLDGAYIGQAKIDPWVWGVSVGYRF